MLLQRFAVVGQTEVERQSGVDNTLLSKFVKGERGLRIDQIEPVLKALGLALIEAGEGDTITVSKIRYEALRALARDGI
jgi:hypothetical protein